MRDKDFAEKETDNLLEELEEKLYQIYKRAYEEMQEKFQKETEKFSKKQDDAFEKWTNGEITEEEYNKILKGIAFRQELSQNLVNELGEDLVKVDQKAMSIANGYMPEAYALNFNYETYDIEQNTQIDTSFTLYNRESVERLVKGNRKILPKRKVDVPKDKKWNVQHLRNEIVQGILQGKSIPDIAKGLRGVTDMNRRASIRNARTMMTGAQNGGRIDAMKRASDLGIRIQKEWMATLDSRTRDSHQKMDGERVGVTRYFSNGLQYPGDPNGAPEEVYNCRCTIASFYPEYEDLIDKRITYQEWAKTKATEPENAPEIIQPVVSEPKYEYDHRQWLDNVLGSRYSEEDKAFIAEAYGEAPERLQKLYEKYGDKLYKLSDTNSRSYFRATDGTYVEINRDIKGCDYQNRFQVSAHESAHNLDWLAGGKDMADYFSQKYLQNGKSFKDIIYEDWDNLFMRKNVGVKVHTEYETIFSKMVGRSARRAQAFFDELETKILSSLPSDPTSSWSQDEIKIFALFNKYKSQVRNINRFYYGWGDTPLKVSEYKKLLADNKDLFEQFMPERWVEIDNGVLDEFCRQIRRELTLSERGNISDMFERYCVEHGGGDYPFGIGHGKDYTLRGGALSRETFAEMIDATLFNEGSLEAIKKYLPNSYDAFLDMLGKVVE